MSGAGDRMLDFGLIALTTESDRVFLCASDPISYADANSVHVGVKNGSRGSMFYPLSSVPGGRMASLAGFNDGNITANGNANFIAIADSVNQNLLITEALSTPKAVKTGGLFSINQMDVIIGKSSQPQSQDFTVGSPVIGVPVFNKAPIAIPNFTVSPPQFGSPILIWTGVNWFNQPFSAQTSTFTCEFDISPSALIVDTVAGLSNGPASQLTDVAASIYFNTVNTIQVRNGNVFAADAVMPYAANQNFHARITGNVATHTYSVWVTPQGQAQVQLANNYAFRTEQAAVTQLNNFARDITEAGSVTISNLTFNSFNAIPLTTGRPVFPNNALNSKIDLNAPLLTTSVPSLVTIPAFNSAGGSGGVLPAGVTLVAIDGETMITATQMSNNYYARNGFTKAVGMGWDAVGYIPTGTFDSTLTNSSFPTVWAAWADLGLNTAFCRYSTADWDIPAMAANNIAGVDMTAQLPTANNIVGYATSDEPNSYQIGTQEVTIAPNSAQDTRFWWVNNTWTWVAQYFSPFIQGAPPPATYQSVAAELITTPNGSKRHLDIISADIYFFAGTRDWGYMNGVGGAASRMYNVTDATPDQSMRGSCYGDQIDCCRLPQTVYPAPQLIYIETGDPFSADPGDGSKYITATEIIWAIWQSLLHGARMVDFFDISFSGPAGGLNPLPLNAGGWYKALHTGQTISSYNAVKSALALMRQMALVLGAPSASGYASVTPVAYVYPTRFMVFNSGVDIHSKWSGNQFYIIASPRASLTVNNIASTFTINANATATQATVMNAAVFMASLSGTTLTVSEVWENNTIVAGMPIFGTGVAAGATIQSQSSGNPGGAGVYVVSAAAGSAPANTVMTGTRTVAISNHQFSYTFPKASSVRIFKIT